MKRILVVDDSCIILFAVKEILTHHYFDVKISGRWSNIQENIDTFRPDLILLDIDLNGADGGEICKTLKRKKDNQKIPIILFSAFNMPQGYIEHHKAQGFISKPFEIPELLEVIGDHVNECIN